jgi:hypothetical protein
MSRNKKTIQQEEERQRKLVLRIARDADELRDLNAKIAKMRAGKIKVPPPAGVKYTINQGYTKTRDWNVDEFGDLIPSFGNAPSIE